MTSVSKRRGLPGSQPKSKPTKTVETTISGLTSVLATTRFAESDHAFHVTASGHLGWRASRM
jgi:hypothetical protein